jgi:antitoxin MazE
VAQIARWGNSLAVRLPVKLVREMNLSEGDTINLRRIDDQTLGMSEDERRRWALEAMRSIAWELPADYKFDREEANAR